MGRSCVHILHQFEEDIVERANSMNQDDFQLPRL